MPRSAVIPQQSVQQVELHLILVPNSAQYNSLSDNVDDRTESLNLTLRSLTKQGNQPISDWQFEVPCKDSGALIKDALFSEIESRLSEYAGRYNAARSTQFQFALATGLPDGVYYYKIDEQPEWCRFFLELIQIDESGTRLPWTLRVPVPHDADPTDPKVEAIDCSVMLSVRHPMVKPEPPSATARRSRRRPR